MKELHRGGKSNGGAGLKLKRCGATTSQVLLGGGYSA